MQENEFEKQVQQSMEGLQLKPSDDVWQNVATAISQKKRKKGFFWIFSSLFFLLIAGILGWSYFMNEQVKNTAAVKRIDTSNHSKIDAALMQPAKSIIANVKESTLENRLVIDIEKFSDSNGLQSIPHSKSLLLVNSKSVLSSQEYSTAINRNVVKQPNYLSKKVKGNSRGKKYIQISNVGVDSFEDEAQGNGLAAIPAIRITGNFYEKPLLPTADISAEVFSIVPRTDAQLIAVSAAQKGNPQRTADKNKKIIWGALWVTFLCSRNSN